jgi:hypothetical protein
MFKEKLVQITQKHLHWFYLDSERKAKNSNPDLLKTLAGFVQQRKKLR